MRRGRAGSLAAAGPVVAACLWPLVGWLLAGCAARSSTAELYPALFEHAGARVAAVGFSGHEPFSRDTLLTLVATQPSRCSFLGIPVCIPLTQWGRQERRLNPEQVRADVASLARFYRAAGYFGTSVTPRVDREGDDIAITFVVNRGDPIIVDLLDVEGTEGILDADSLEEQLPLRPGSIFDLGRLAAAWEQVGRALSSRGHAYAEVLRNFSVDTLDNSAEVTLVAVPGPRVIVDSIVVLGADRLGRRAALRQLTFRPGDLLHRSDLTESQRNLYDLELVQIAAVSVAHDSLQAHPGDSTTATVAVQIAEAPVHQVEAAFGFGQEECFRTEAQWLSRSFAGGARRLALIGSLGRIGAGEPFRLGSGELCRAAAGDTITEKFDYRLSADFGQPNFLSPRNRLTASVYAERLSEPRVFQREALGSRLGVTRRLGDRTFVSASLEGERGRTRASAVLFCAAFRFCEPEIADSLGRPRFRGDLNVSFSHDRTDLALDPTRGFSVRTGVVWASAWLASEVEFVRWTGEGAVYRTLSPGWVLAGALRLGNFLRTATLNPQGNFLPPEERFFAGGASSVRGFDRNELGRGIWVTDSVGTSEAGDTLPLEGPTFYATGGTSLAVASLELRLPSPVLSRLVGLAAFLDGGTVSSGSLWDFESQDWKLTPGAGLRLRTPVGPVRLDVAYNPYGRPGGPLLLSDTASGTIRRVGSYQPGPPSGFVQRLRVHLAIGQAF